MSFGGPRTAAAYNVVVDEIDGEALLNFVISAC